MVKSSSYRPQCYRGAHTGSGEHEQQETPEPFFNRYGSPVQSGKNSSFFQTKLSIGQPNDHFEKEADRVADKVVNQKSSGPVIQKKDISSVQRLVTSKEEERLGTNDARMLKDKEIQEKLEIQRMCEDCEKEKEGNKVQRKTMPVNEEERKPPKTMAGEKEKEEEVVQSKADGTSVSGSPSLSSRIHSSAGNGRALPHHTLSEMQSSFNTDFSHVKIHTGADAVSMNKALGAQAFTHGSDIYFNSGKYDPQTSKGKQLLAHELTHVIQQGSGRSLYDSVQRSCNDGACDSCLGGQRDFWITLYFRRRATRKTMTYLRQQINEAKRILANCCLTLKADFNWKLLKGGGTFNFMDANPDGSWHYSNDASTLGTGNTFAGSNGLPVLVVDEVPRSGGGVTVDERFDSTYQGRSYAVIGVNQTNPNPGCNHLAHELWHVGSGIIGHDVAHGTLAACQGNDVSPEFCRGLRNIVAPVGDFPTPSRHTAVA